MNGGEVGQDIYSVKLDVLHADVSEMKAALNKLSDAITKLALVEQQQRQTAASLERAFNAITKIEERLVNLEKTQPQHTEVAKWVDRGLVALAGAGAVLIGKSAGLG